MRFRRPPPLRAGDRIGVAAPGGPVRVEAFERGLACLEARGFRTIVGASARQRHGYLAGGDRERLADLAGFIADPGLAAIWSARGGYGSGRIVADLDFAALRRHPKGIIGYSDITILQAAAYRHAGVGSWHGPLVSELGDETLYDAPFLWRALSGDGSGLSWGIDRASVVRPGAGEGPLLGGCLSLLVGLIGTPQEAPLDGAVLFWEEVNEEPFRIDRMLGHLRRSGTLQRLAGMIVGRLVGCDGADPANVLSLREILETHLAGTGYPVVIDFPAGHAPSKSVLPYGSTVRLDTGAGRLAVSGP